MTSRTWTYALMAVACTAFALGYHGVSLFFCLIALCLEIFSRGVQR